MVKYERCKVCRAIVRVLDGETKCIYCENDLVGDRATERAWREYLKGSQYVMQPFEYRDIKPSIQTTFVKELIERKEKDK